MEPARPGNERQGPRLGDGLRLIAGILAAAIAAGPVLVLMTMAAAALAGVGAQPDDGFLRGGSFWLLLAQAVREVFLPALIASTLGAVSLAVAGAMVVEARTYKVWVVGGGIEALLVCLLVPDLLKPVQLAAAVAVTGMVCAAICRAFVRWPEAEGGAQA
jgi:hypothetical protein